MQELHLELAYVGAVRLQASDNFSLAERNAVSRALRSACSMWRSVKPAAGAATAISWDQSIPLIIGLSEFREASMPCSRNRFSGCFA